MPFNALTWIGLCIAGIGWVLLIVGSAPESVDFSGLGVGRGRTPVVNLHLVSVYSNMIITGLAVAVLGAIQEAADRLRPVAATAEPDISLIRAGARDPEPHPVQTGAYRGYRYEVLSDGRAQLVADRDAKFPDEATLHRTIDDGVAEQPLTAPESVPVERGTLGGRGYVKLQDGTVEVRTLIGPRRFSSMGEAAEYLGVGK